MKKLPGKWLAVLLMMTLLFSSTAVTGAAADGNVSAAPDAAESIPITQQTDPQEPEEVVQDVELLTGTANAAENKERLNEALALAGEGIRLTVRIASPGTYYIGGTDGGSAVRLHSNTVLDLNGATLTRYGSMYNLIQNSDYDNNRDIGQYALSHDITVQNGTLDGRTKAPEPSNLVNIGHATAVSFIDVNFRNSEGHLLEFSGCQDCLVRNCTFSGYLGSYSDASEAVQLDISNNDTGGVWNGVYVSDGTVCRRITVDHCTFNDYPSGVGNHKSTANPISPSRITAF